MKQKILDTLGGLFKYDPNVQKKFQDAFYVRYDRKSEVYHQFQDFFSAQGNLSLLLSEKNFVEELKRLNLMAIKSRLAFIDEHKVQETVVISYMRQLVKEIEYPSLYVVSANLEHAEEVMFNHLLDVAVLNEDLTELEGISNINLRLVLQSWLLYPEYLTQSEKLDELIDCLSLAANLYL